jgi:hypothetical protein
MLLFRQRFVQISRDPGAVLLVEIPGYVPEHLGRLIKASRNVIEVFRPFIGGPTYATDRRKSRLLEPRSQFAMELAVKTVVKPGEFLLCGAAHKTRVGMMPVDNSAYDGWPNTVAQLLDQCRSASTQPHEVSGAAGNISEILSDAAPVDVVGPGTGVEWSGRMPPGNRVEFSVGAALKYIRP